MSISIPRSSNMKLVRETPVLNVTVGEDSWSLLSARSVEAVVPTTTALSARLPGPASELPAAFPSAGSIAFTGFNADDPDSLAFAVIEDIAAGSVIIFDDNEWSGTAFNTGEGTITLTLTSAVAAGTIVRIDATNTATPTTSTGTVTRGGSFDLSGTTESLYAYTGSAAAPTFLAAIGISGFTGATTTGLLTNTGLTLGTNAIDIGVIDAGADIAAYNGTRSGQGSFAAYLSIINNTANWLTQDAAGSQAGDGTAPDVPFDATAFTVSGAAPGQLAIANASVTEGNSGTAPISFTVTRANGTTGAVSATWTLTAAGGAGNADAGDFAGAQPFTGTVSFADGETSKAIVLNVQGDTVAEANEAFTVTLSAPTGGATLGTATATGTINDDDASNVAINDMSVTEGNGGTSILTFTVSRTGGAGAFDVDFASGGGTATAGTDYLSTSGTLNFAAGENVKTIQVTINGDTTSEPNETFNVTLSNPTNGAVISDGTGVGTIQNDDITLVFIHDIQGSAYYSPILIGNGINGFNLASTTTVTVRAVVTALDNVGTRQGYYLTEEFADWDANSLTSEGIFVMTRNDSNVGSVVSGVAVGDIVTVTAQVMEYQAFSSLPRTVLVNSTASVVSTGNSLPTFTLGAGSGVPNAVMNKVTPDFTGTGSATFDATTALSFWETVEGMLVTIPNMVVADGFVQTSGGRPYLQAYSTDHANPNQINSRGGYTIAGDPPSSPPDTAGTGDDTLFGGRHIYDGDVNPDLIEVDFTDFAVAPPASLTTFATMGDRLGDLTGIVDFDFTDRKLFVTNVGGTGFVDNGQPLQETTAFGSDSRSLTIATFNVENLGGNATQLRFDAIANAMKNNLKAPDILCVEEIQDNDGTGTGAGADASTTWQKLVDALNLATGKVYQWVDQEPVNNSDGGAPNGNIRVGFVYDTARVQLGDLAANAVLADRRKYTDRIGDGVRDAGDLIAYSDNQLGGEIVTTDWTTTRKSLLGEFSFNGNKVFVTANHWPSKIGSGQFWQLDQNIGAGSPANSDWAQRNAVAQDVYAMMNLIQTSAPNAGIVAGGDFNEFQFNRPLEVLTGYVTTDGAARVGGSRFDNLTISKLPEAERYTYTFDGRAQAIDHVVANARLANIAGYDIVHLNTGYNAGGGSPALSDHEPAVASFDFRSLAEVLTGTGGADYIDGFGGDDVINGGLGADVLVGGAGTDQLNGGAGNDQYLVDVAADIVNELSGDGDDIVFTLASYTLGAGQEIEELAAASPGSAAALDLTGNELANRLYGSAGANVLNGGAGGDLMFAFAGNDTYNVDDAADRVFEFAGEGDDKILTTISYTLAPGSEVEELSAADAAATTRLDLTGNEFTNRLNGNAGVNIIVGRGGADTMTGLGGDDQYLADVAGDQVVEGAGGGYDIVFALTTHTLTAGAHVEELSVTDHAATNAINLFGNELANGVYGNAGANTLAGRGGSDTLAGYGGADSFVFDTALAGAGVDRIIDFEVGVDKIALDDTTFGGLASVNASNFVTSQSGAQNADHRIIYDSVAGALFFDADGNGAGGAVLFAALTPGLPLTANDFVVI